MFCARQVFRCFKFVEKLGERLVGAVGPYFVAAALSLISVGVVCFCTSDLPPMSVRRLFIDTCTSRSYIANAILPLDHDTDMSADCIQSIRTLLLCLHGFTWLCRRSTARDRHRILLVSEKAGANAERNSAGFWSRLVREPGYHTCFYQQVQKVWTKAARGVSATFLMNQLESDSFLSREVSPL